ncbi:hypothetical protein FTW19_23215 [Terriglobus albidus]|uniref:Zinc-finger domain-containing protein n=1 Tax=Terriglobus albidus TaxID=1592106 RepID=A0A5B9EF22_9BACT|nr:carboxypeptidase regulatory-like domain-containing protein [Terriglobus albidus]QEE30642.1 hypothetical protein FTW19_23215 [Terriglobus albidus]
MNEPLQPGHHLDADQLAAFVEGALTPQERQESLTHMAVCEQCRSIAFLMQEPQTAIKPATEPAPVAAPQLPFWRRFTPLVYASGLGVFATVLIVFAWMHQRSVPPPKADIAHIAPAPVPEATPRTTPEATPAKPVIKENAKRVSPQPAIVRRSPVAAPVTASAVMSKTAASDAVAVATQNRTARLVTLAPGATITSPLESRQLHDLPLNGRAASQYAAAPAAKSVSPALLFPPPNGELALRIEHGQSVPGSQAKVTGVVLDLSGATIPGATITLRQPNTPLRQTKTDNTGNFTLASLPAGKYNLEIAAPGFQTVNQSLDLLANDVALLTSQVPVGSTTESVDVTPEAAVLMTQSASVASIPVETKLPYDAQIAERVQRDKRILVLGSGGKIYLSTNNGKRWKTIKPLWDGKASRIEAAEHGPGFSLTTEAGTVWSSDDGQHWRKR